MPTWNNEGFPVDIILENTSALNSTAYHMVQGTGDV